MLNYSRAKIGVLKNVPNARLGLRSAYVPGHIGEKVEISEESYADVLLYLSSVEVFVTEE